MSSVSSIGISLEELQVFVTENQDWLSEKRTDEVVGFIKDRTKDLHSAYDQWIARSGRPGGVGKATHFVSHTWKGRFLDLFSALKVKFSKETNPFFWIDIFVVPQNDVDKPTGENVWYDAFDNMVGAIGSVVVVLDSFDDPIYLRRAWCLFEFFVAMQRGVALEVILSPGEEDRLARFLEAGNNHLDLFSRIDFANAEASVAADEQRIKARVERELPGGFQAVNELVLARLREWLVTAARAALDRLPPADRVASELQRQCGAMLFWMGRYDEAAELLVPCAAAGNPHARTALGSVRERQGRFAEALGEFAACLDRDLRALGPWDPAVATDYGNVGNAYAGLGMLHEALAMHQKDLEIRRRAGDSGAAPAADPGRALYNVGEICRRLQRHAEALDYLQEARRVRAEALGAGHALVADALGAVGSAHQGLGRLVEAAAAHEEALQIRRAALGAEHESTATSVFNLALVNRDLGRIDAARAGAAEAHAIFLRRLGPSHPFTTEAARFVAQLSAPQPVRRRCAVPGPLQRLCLATLADSARLWLTPFPAALAGSAVATSPVRVPAGVRRLVRPGAARPTCPNGVDGAVATAGSRRSEPPPPPRGRRRCGGCLP